MGFFKSLGRLFGGRKPSVQQAKRFTPGQESALNQLLSRGMADTDPAAMEQRQQNIFNRDTVPGLAERFTSMGGGQRSSAFEESLRRGGLEMGEQLAGLRQQSGMQALNMGLTPQFENFMDPGEPGILGGLIGGAGKLGLLKLGGMMGLGTGGGLFGQGAGRAAQAAQGSYMPGQPKGMRKGINPILLKIMQGIQL